MSKNVERPRIDLVKIKWYGRHEFEDGGWVDRVLDAIHTHLPQAAPVRFSANFGETWELFAFDGPPRPRFDAACTHEQVSWRGVSLGYGGSISGLASAQTRAANPSKFSDVTITVDARLAEAALLDGGLRPVVAAMVGAVGAVYAYAYWERGVVYDKRGDMWWDSQSDHSMTHVLMGREWQGLPWDHVWLEWFGSEYAPLVAEPLAGLASPLAGGLLAEYGWDQKERFRRMPRSFLADDRDGGRAQILPPGW